MSLAQITVIGNVGNPPEIRKTPNGKEVCNFSIAVNRKQGDKKITTWFTVVSWDERKNNILSQYVHKGDQICVVGALGTREYTDRQGVDRTSLEVDISFNGTLTLLNNERVKDSDPHADERRSSGGGRASGNRSGNGAKRQSAPPPSDMDDDIPF